jgi:hypothetical protein
VKRRVAGFGLSTLGETLALCALLSLIPGAVLAAVMDLIRWWIGAQSPVALVALLSCLAAGAVAGAVLYHQGE